MSLLLRVIGTLNVLGGLLALGAYGKAGVPFAVSALVGALFAFLLGSALERLDQLEGRLAAIEATGPTTSSIAQVIADEAEAKQEDVDEVAEGDAKALLKIAQDHHFAKNFDGAKNRYKEIVARYPATKSADAARRQLENLKKT